MNCSEVSERLCAYADGELPRSFREAIDGHLENCPRCRGEAERLTANLAFMKSAMSTLAAGDADDASFLDILKPKTRAEVAAAEREITGEAPTHRLRTAIIALIVLAAAVIAWFVVFAGDREDAPDEATRDKRGAKADAPPETEAPDRPRTNRPRRDPKRPPRGTPRPVPLRPKGGVDLDDLPTTLAGAMRKRNAASAIPRIVQAASRALKTGEQVSRFRNTLARAGSPEITGLMLLVLGAAPDPASYRPMLLTRLRSDPAAAVRSAAALALCRSGSRGRRVRYLDRYAIPVGAVPPEVTPTLLTALATESDASVRGTFIDLVGPTSPRDAKVANALVERLVRGTDEATSLRILTALSGSRHPRVTEELVRWLESGSVPAKLLGHAVGLVRTMDAKRGAKIAGSLLQTTREVGARRALLGSLAGGTDDATLSVLKDILRSDPDASMRRQAVELLSGAPPAKVRDALAAAEQGDADPEVRRAAAGAIRAMKRREQDPPKETGER